MPTEVEEAVLGLPGLRGLDAASGLQAEELILDKEINKAMQMTDEHEKKFVPSGNPLKPLKYFIV